MRNCKEKLKQDSGRCERWLTTSTYRKKQYDVFTSLEDFLISELDGVFVCQNKPFWTGSRAKHDIIGGAQGWWCVIRKENANA